MTTTLVPYPRLPGTVSLAVENAAIDGVALSRRAISEDDRSVALERTEFGDWRRASFTIRLEAPQLHGDDRWSDVQAVAVLEERATRTRTVTPLSPTGEGVFRGTAELARADHTGRVRLSGQIVATVGGIRGRAIATAAPFWTIDLKTPDPTRKEAVTTCWVDFGADEDSYLYRYREAPWTLDTSGDAPVVYLNSGFEGLRETLHGRDKATRAALAAEIAVESWTALFDAAVDTVPMHGERPEWPSGWPEDVLSRMLPQVFPEMSPEDALAETVARARFAGGSGDLQARVQYAAGRKARLPRRLGDFIRAASRKEGQ
ncbi:hypothetical protein [Streptomonospora salina]|uniref:Uncharacterized protein n=1 Tax=Streptomonospora salina TaxID=104205 RepID=A0A841E343_9ACTN|nr:hypothetical protein [Streptomonospora salina]MBB5998237.1 hypothetical protein [Streptomonospora salina]